MLKEFIKRLVREMTQIGFLFIAAVACAIIIAWPIQLLWNDVVVDIFKTPSITFWQAMGLSVLCSLLFKSISSSKD
jgi:hypothetical protein